MKTRSAFTALALTAAALAWTGCGTTCPTETPQVQAVQSCTVAPGATVTVNLRLCPTCNQTPITCNADLSAAAGSGQIHLDPLAEACEGSTSCPPSCSSNTVGCTFQAPSAPGSYTLLVFDPASGNTLTGTLQVTAGPASCSTI